MQYYDAHQGYGVVKNYRDANPEAAQYYISRLKIVAPNCAKLVNFFRKHNLRVFFANFGSSMLDGSDMHPLRKMRLKEVSAFTTQDFEYQILDELKPKAGEFVVSKSTRGAFVGTGLAHKMKMIGVETVVVVEAATEVCVASTARGAWDHVHKVILINDATAGFTAEDQKYT
jgi:nicotinamidase-related amidase